MPQTLCQCCTQLPGIRDVAVMGRADAVGVVGEQRLGLCAGRRACSGVSDMADPKITAEHEHVMLLEDLGDEAIVLAQVEVAFFGGDDAGGVWLG